jgi:hypothetical protein
MATRSRIGLKLDDGKIKQVYCHWDGYVEGVGLTLVENYNTIDKVEELINLGDISSLGFKISTDEPHTFDNPVNGVTVAYSRDRGETGVEAQTLTMDEWMSVAYSSPIDFYYLFSDGEWWVFKLCRQKGWKNVKSFFPQYILTKEELTCTI